MSRTQPRRPKGVQTASSTQAAELVVQTGTVNAFALFQAGFNPVAGSPAVASPIDNSEPEGEYMVVIRRLSKRDPTTRLKALKQLEEMLRRDDDDEPVVACLAEWCQIYVRLTEVHQKQLRELTYSVMSAIFARSKVVKKAMERHIKQVIGCWVCNMHDNEREVRTAAQQAWRAAFTDDVKELAGLKICRKEIFNHLAHNLAVTPQTIKADHKASPEETDQIYECLLSSSLLAAGFVLRKLHGNVEEADLYQGCSSLLTPEVWKVVGATNKLVSVRIGFYEYLIALMQCCPDALQEYNTLKNATKCLLLDGFSEKESAVFNHWWPAVLALLRKFPESWDMVTNPGMTLFPRIFALLRRTTGMMSLQVMYQSLLPFLMVIPRNVIDSSKENGLTWFSGEFLCCLWKGIQSDAMIPIAVPALVDSYIECWKYFALTMAGKQAGDNCDTVLQQHLIHHHLLPACLHFLLGRNIRTQPSVFCEPFGLLLTKLGGHSLGQLLVDNFWTPLLDSLLQALKEDRDITAPAADACISEHAEDQASAADAKKSKKPKADATYGSVIHGTCASAPRTTWIERTVQLLEAATAKRDDWQPSFEAQFSSALAPRAHEFLTYALQGSGPHQSELGLVLRLWQLVKWEVTDDKLHKAVQEDVRLLLVPRYRQLCACLPLQKEDFENITALIGYAVCNRLLEGPALVHAAKFLADFRQLCPKLTWNDAGMLLATLTGHIAIPLSEGTANKDCAEWQDVAKHLSGMATDLITVALKQQSDVAAGAVQYLSLLASTHALTSGAVDTMLQGMVQSLQLPHANKWVVLSVTLDVLMALSSVLDEGMQGQEKGAVLVELLSGCLLSSIECCSIPADQSLYLSPRLLGHPKEKAAKGTNEDDASGPPEQSNTGDQVASGCDELRAFQTKWRELVIRLVQTKCLERSAITQKCLDGVGDLLKSKASLAHHLAFIVTLQSLLGVEPNGTASGSVIDRWTSWVHSDFHSDILNSLRLQRANPLHPLPTSFTQVWATPEDPDAISALSCWVRHVRFAECSLQSLAQHLPADNQKELLRGICLNTFTMETTCEFLTNRAPEEEALSLLQQWVTIHGGCNSSDSQEGELCIDGNGVPSLSTLLLQTITAQDVDILAIAAMAKFIMQHLSPPDQCVMHISVLSAVLNEEEFPFAAVPVLTTFVSILKETKFCIDEAPVMSQCSALMDLLRPRSEQFLDASHGLADSQDTLLQGLCCVSCWISCCWMMGDKVSHKDVEALLQRLQLLRDELQEAILHSSQTTARLSEEKQLPAQQVLLQVQALCTELVALLPEPKTGHLIDIAKAVHLAITTNGQERLTKSSEVAIKPLSSDVQLLPVELNVLSGVLQLSPAEYPETNAELLPCLYTALLDRILATGFALVHLLGSQYHGGSLSPQPLLKALHLSLGLAEKCPAAMYINIDMREAYGGLFIDLLLMCHSLCVGSFQTQGAGQQFPGEMDASPAWLVEFKNRFGIDEAQAIVARVVSLCGRFVSLSIASPLTCQALLNCASIVASSPTPASPICDDSVSSPSCSGADLEAIGATDEDTGPDTLKCPLPLALAALLSQCPPRPHLPEGAIKKVNLRYLQRILHHHMASPLCRLSMYSWLMAWKLSLDLRPETQDLIKWIRKSSLMPSALELSFAYLLAPVRPSAVNTSYPDPSSGPPSAVGTLMDAVSLPEDRSWPFRMAKEGLTCYALGLASLDFLRQAMTSFPSMVRVWWGGTDRVVSDVVEKFVLRHISPHVINAELEGIQIQLANLKAGDTELCPDEAVGQMLVDEEVDVKVLMGSRLVVITYNKDDATVAMNLKVPASYPLRTIDVAEDEASRKLRGGIREDKWRLWLLRMTIMLFSQNTTLWKCVLLWCSNLAKHFTGVEPCPICYSIISQANQRLPELKCQVCKNSKFHSLCLLKWFKTAGNNSCPICRSPWY